MASTDPTFLAKKTRVKDLMHRKFTAVFVALLALIVGLLYLPALTSFFISDDFSYVTWLYRDIKSFLAGQMLWNWFIGGPDGYLYFRPAGHALMLLDYVAWNLNPIGYHLTNVTLHFCATFEIFLLTRLLVRGRLAASIAALFFAILPIHAGAVSWIAARYDVLCGVFYFASLIFYVLFRQKNKIRFYLISIGAFALALSAKEVAITFPVLLLIYEAVFPPKKPAKAWNTAVRLVPFGVLLALYFGFRLFVTMGFGYPGTPLTPQTAWDWLGRVFLIATDPFLADLSLEGQGVLLIALVSVLIFSRFRREIVLSLACVLVPFATTISSGPSDRSFYVPSFGLCLMLALILSELAQHQGRTVKAVGIASVILISIVYSLSLFSRNQAFHKAGEITEAIPLQVKTLHPTLPAGARLVFVGVPDQVPEGPLVYLTGFPGLLTTLYQDWAFRVFKFQKFPIWLDELDKTYFFEVDHRHVADRADLVNAIEKRLQCENASYSTVDWTFSNDVQGWEPWNQLSDFAIRDGLLFARSDGNDPYMVSPLIDIPSIAIGDVAVTMRVRASKPEMNGKIYWLATGQGDFSPALQMPFTIKADGEYHTYRIDISQSNQLLLGDHIQRLRLNPAEGNAEIEVKEIQVYAHCSAVQGEDCTCSP